jgi:hypothetical protein
MPNDFHQAWSLLNRSVVRPADWDDELIAFLAAERAGLGEAHVRIWGLAAAELRLEGQP